jgi:zinc protease
MVHRETLPNGLTVVVRELPGAPAVALSLWMRSGSGADPEELAGVSHFLEHLLFKGRGSSGPRDLALEVQAMGGFLNAETGVDHTAFYQVVPVESWTRVLDGQACVVSSPDFDHAAVETERKVIIEEARSSERDPWGFLWRRLMETAFVVHPCRRPVLGTPGTLARISHADLVAHHRWTCRPGNLAQVIVGDVDAREAVRRCADLYGSLGSARAEAPGAGEEARGGPGREQTTEPPQDALRSRGFVGDLKQPYLAVSFHTVPVLHEDSPPLDVLAALLGGGRSSRLSRSLRLTQGIVSDVSAGHVGMSDVGALAVRAVVSGGDADGVTSGVFREIESLRRQAPSAGEMAKILRRLEASYAIEHETAEAIGWTLGSFEAYGDCGYAETYVDRLAAVTCEDVVRVARTYLAPGNATVVTYVPRGGKMTVGDRSSEVDALVMGTVRGAETAVVREPACGWRAAPFARPTVIAERTAPASSRTGLPGGGTLVGCRIGGLPLVSVALGFRGGLVDEPDGILGSTYLLQKLLVRGTRDLTALELADLMEGLGSAIATASDRDGFGFGATVLSSMLEDALPLLMSVAAEPGLRADDFAAVRTEVAAEIGEIEDHPGRLAMHLLMPLLFPEHGYGRPLRGTRETLGRLSLDDVRARHRCLCDPSRLAVCLAGDFPADRVGREVAGMATRLAGAADCAPSAVSARSGPVRLRPSGRVDVEGPRMPQSAILVGFAAPPAGSDDSVAMRVLSTGLSMMGGRLWRALRERPPHAYAVHATHLALLEGGGLIVHATSQPGSEEQVLAAILREATDVASRGLAAPEADRARNHLAGALGISLERRAARAGGYAMAEVMGLGYERVERLPQIVRGVTNDDVARVAREYLEPSRGFASVTVRGKA